MGKVKDQLWNEPEFDNDFPCETQTQTGTDMHISKMTSSNFLKKEDVDPAILVTITRVEQKDVSMADQPEELKWCLYFQEVDKPLVLNMTNIQLAAVALKSEETNEWVNGKLVLYNDPSISFAGKITGGIRVRAPRNQVQPQQAQPQQVDNSAATQQGATAGEPYNDDIPF